MATPRLPLPVRRQIPRGGHLPTSQPLFSTMLLYPGHCKAFNPACTSCQRLIAQCSCVQRVALCGRTADTDTLRLSVVSADSLSSLVSFPRPPSYPADSDSDYDPEHSDWDRHVAADAFAEAFLATGLLAADPKGPHLPDVSWTPLSHPCVSPISRAGSGGVDALSEVSLSEVASRSNPDAMEEPEPDQDARSDGRSELMFDEDARS